MIAQYEVNTKSPDVCRLTQLTIGGTNSSGVPAGGIIRYQYQLLTPEPPDINTPVFQNTVTDRNGNIAQYQFNKLGNVVQVIRYPRGLRRQEPPEYKTLYTYNADGLLLSRTKPLGNTVSYTYDDRNSDRFQQGNLLSVVRRPDAVRGGDQTSLTTLMTYEPIYNQLLTYTSARGNDPGYVPQNGGSTSPSRYRRVYTYDYQEGTDYEKLAAEIGVIPAAARARLAAVPMNLGDVNGDTVTNQTNGTRIRVARPSVTLLPGSKQSALEGSASQPIVSLYCYNQFGQVVTRTDPEGNRTDLEYYSEGPSSGYLRRVTTDTIVSPARDSRTNPTPVSLGCIYHYDAVGNLIRSIDGRGIATDYAVNQLNQVVQIKRATAHNLNPNALPEPMVLTDFGYLLRLYYDSNGNVVRREVEDRGNMAGTGGFVSTEFTYNILNHKVQVTVDLGPGTSINRLYRYDPNGNCTLSVQPEGNATAYMYDERNLRFQTIFGAAAAPPATLGATQITSSRGGVPSMYTRNYDPNGNLIEFVDAADKDGSAENNSSIAGVGDVTAISYDGFDRPRSLTDAVGSETACSYDPAGNIIRLVRSGTLGGPSRTTNATGANVTLRVTELRHDELNRVFQRDRHLFVATGTTTTRPASISDGPLTPGDGKVTTRFEYDRNSRLTFIVDDSANTSCLFYDGANRKIKVVDPESNIREYAYDGNGNLIETRATDVPQKAGLGNEIFFRTYFYDALNRLQRRVSNLGHATDYRYNFRDNVVSIADPNGPFGGSTITRRAFTGGSGTSNATNRFGNVTLYTYDALNRLVRRDRVMTASGKGDGVNNGADIYGNRSTLPTPDVEQAGGDGLVTVRYQWDRNSLLTSLTDDNGNQTQRTYDNHNRLLSETRGASVAPGLASRVDPLTTVSFSYGADGNRIRIVDQNGSVISNQFDAISRLISTQIEPAVGVIGTTVQEYQYDGCNRLTCATDNNEPADPSDDATIMLAYDSLSRVVEETQQFGQTPALAVNSAWEGNNRRVGLTYPNGRVLRRTFDHLNRLASVADADATTPIATYSYFGRHRVIERRYP